MVRKQAVYARGDSLTPDVAAGLADIAERCRSRLEMECAGKRVLLDSLIGILSLPCQRGSRLTVFAEGEDEADAAAAIVRMLENGNA